MMMSSRRLGGGRWRVQPLARLPLLLLLLLLLLGVARVTPAKGQAAPPPPLPRAVAVAGPAAAPAPVAAAPPPLDEASLRPAPRIVGDNEDARNAGPTVSIGYPSYWGGDSFCTGTLISATAVLTAAHCLDGWTASYEGRVVLGSERLPSSGCPSVPRGEYEEVDFDGGDVYIHEKYNGGKLQYDLAVIVLRRPVTSVQPAKLNMFDKKIDRKCQEVKMQG